MHFAHGRQGRRAPGGCGDRNPVFRLRARLYLGCAGREAMAALRLSVAAESERWRWRSRHADRGPCARFCAQFDQSLELRRRQRSTIQRSILNGSFRKCAISRSRCLVTSTAITCIWRTRLQRERRRQKLVEESPSPALDQPTRRRMAEAAVALINELPKYVNARPSNSFSTRQAGNSFSSR